MGNCDQFIHLRHSVAAHTGAFITYEQREWLAELHFVNRSSFMGRRADHSDAVLTQLADHICQRNLQYRHSKQ